MPNILVIRFGAMGDLIHVSASLQQLHFQRPDSAITLLTAPALLPLAQQFTGLTQVLSHSPKAGLRDWMKLGKALRQHGFDQVVNLQPSLKTRFLAAMTGAPSIHHYHKQKLSLRGAAVRSAARFHAVEDFYRVFQQACDLAPADRHGLAPRLDLSGASGPKQASQHMVLVPGVGVQRPNRAWPLDRYIALAQTLLAEFPSLHIQVIGGPEEAALAERLSQVNLERIHNTCGRLALLETAALLTQAVLVLGGDTGPMHLAAALGRPCIGLFGPTDVHRTGLLAQPDQTVIHLTPPDALPCWPCEKPHCKNNPAVTDTCLETLPVEAVLNAARGVLNGL